VSHRERLLETLIGAPDDELRRYVPQSELIGYKKAPSDG
jgi:hypothetical protein